MKRDSAIFTMYFDSKNQIPKLMNVLSSEPIQFKRVLGVIRIIVGLLMVYHGHEVFNSELMQGYIKWDVFKNKAATVLAYAGKSSELIAGLLLTLGLLTRVGAVLLTGTMLYITFFIGQGRFWYEEQHPFMFVLFGVLFTFLGAGAWSLDGVLSKNNGRAI
jgi:putative oxidoreductase